MVSSRDGLGVLSGVKVERDGVSDKRDVVLPPIRLLRME